MPCPYSHVVLPALCSLRSTTTHTCMLIIDTFTVCVLCVCVCHRREWSACFSSGSFANLNVTEWSCTKSLFYSQYACTLRVFCVGARYRTYTYTSDRWHAVHSSWFAELFIHRLRCLRSANRSCSGNSSLLQRRLLQLTRCIACNACNACKIACFRIFGRLHQQVQGVKSKSACRISQANRWETKRKRTKSSIIEQCIRITQCMRKRHAECSSKLSKYTIVKCWRRCMYYWAMPVVRLTVAQDVYVVQSSSAHIYC
jgi:hypothetical protein